LNSNNRVAFLIEQQHSTFALFITIMAKTNRIILCVDDDPDDQYMIQETIKSIEPTATIISALNGQEAMDYLSQSEQAGALPCLIIMDINMPVMDGKMALSLLKKQASLSNIPVVMFTTSSSKLDQTFFEYYKIPFLTKPIKQADLFILVEKMLAFGKC
jgi:CheY-like chemotaxis protein